MAISDAHHEGSLAYWRGDMPEMNPYDEKDAQSEEWVNGYIEADIAESGECE